MLRGRVDWGVLATHAIHQQSLVNVELAPTFSAHFPGAWDSLHFVCQSQS